MMLVLESVVYVLVSALTFVIYRIAAGAKRGFEFWKETIFMTVLVLLALGALQYVVSMSGNACFCEGRRDKDVFGDERYQ